MTGYPFSCLPDEFKGKRVLITGGTKGVGAATVGTASGVREVVDRIEREGGGIDILVNNVSGTETKPGGFEVPTDQDWQRKSRNWSRSSLATGRPI